MATVTNWFKFKKPEVSDAADIGVINENMDMLDGLLGTSIYVANGMIVGDVDGYIRGIGTATVTVEAATGLARIDFSVQLTVGGTNGANSMQYGIDRDALRTINPNIPLINAIDGGVITMYSGTSGTTISQTQTHFGGYMNGHSNGRFWIPSRVYDLNTDGVTGKTGTWQQAIFSQGDRWVGTCFGRKA